MQPFLNCKSASMPRSKKPCPLNGAEEGQPPLGRLSLAHTHQLEEDEALERKDQHAKIPSQSVYIYISVLWMIVHMHPYAFAVCFVDYA